MAAQTIADIRRSDQFSGDQPRRRRIRWGTVALHGVLIFVCLTILAPFAWIFLESLKSLPDSVQRHIWPNQFADPLWISYEGVLRKRELVIKSVRNSVLVSVGTVFLTTTLSVLAGYALVHLRTPGRNVIVAILVASTFFPSRVTALIGIFNMQDNLGLINQTWSLMLPYTALSTAFSIFIMRGVFQGIPRDIVDSTKVDGASSLRALIGVVLPLVRNGVVVVMIVNFNAAWGEYLLARTLMNDAMNRTLPVFISGASGGIGALARPGISALYVLAIVPSLIFFGIAQHWYMKGLQEGALKT